MSDNEDLLADDLGDHSLADYNLGNEEEEQLLADDYDMGASQNVPTLVGPYRDNIDMGPAEYAARNVGYNQSMQYHTSVMAETECIVPNISVEVPTAPLPEHSTYAPYEPPVYEAEHAVVPPAIPAAPIESPQIVPSEMTATIGNGDVRERFVSERPQGAQRTPQVRNIPDSLDKVYVPRGAFGRGRGAWRSAHFRHHNHPYRRNNMQRGNFTQRASFTPSQNRATQPQVRPEIFTEVRPEIRPELPLPQIRVEIHEIRPEVRPEMCPELRPEIRPDVRPELRPELRPEIHPEMRPEMHPEMRPEMHPDLRPPMLEMRHELRPGMHPMMQPLQPIRQEIRPELPAGIHPDLSQLPPHISPERPMLPVPDMLPFRIDGQPPLQFQRFPFRPSLEERPFIPRAFEPRPMFFQPPFPRFAPAMREIAGNHIPQVTVRQEPEVRMLPVLPPILPPVGLAGKKVLINPHFKGNFQPPVEGPVKDIDDAAERFIAEQRNALARAASRKFARRSPQRYIENTTIEIENELARAPRRRDDAELLRRQEEFISANRAGLRRRMRSPSPPPAPPRRSPSPRRSAERRAERRPPPADEESEYRRRMREQESKREHVLRAKEVRRRRAAALLQRQLASRDREQEEKPSEPVKTEEALKPEPAKEPPKVDVKPTTTSPNAPKPDTTRKSPEKAVKEEVVRERSPHREENAEIDSTCEALTPPRPPPRALTPPLPPAGAPAAGAAGAGAGAGRRARGDSDDELDLILDDIDGILSDDDDSGRFKDTARPVETPKPHVDLRSKLPPKAVETKRPPRQKITFSDVKEKEKEKEDKKKKGKEKSPMRRTIVSSTNKVVKTEASERKLEPEKEREPKADPEAAKGQPFSNRRVILQRKLAQREIKKSIFGRAEAKSDPSQPHPGIFSRAVRTAIGSDNNRIVVKKSHEPKVEYDSESDYDEERLLEDDSGATAAVANLPHGMTDTRLKTLAGGEVQSLELDRENRKAQITFKSPQAAESFKKKFNNKMVAASRLSVTLC